MEFIESILINDFNQDIASEIYNNDPLIVYLKNKTKAADRSSKSRGSFANIYAIYVLVEDYINKGYLKNQSSYINYEGMQFTNALNRIRELPYGSKLQNHALNDRCNDEFRKFNHTITEEVPIKRNLHTKRYWINDKLLQVSYGGKEINLAPTVIKIIDKYVELRTANFNDFFRKLKVQELRVKENPEESIEFLASLIKPNVDARLFEIASYVIIKYFYIEDIMVYSINHGPSIKKNLTVYKTGRTNANDGGVDYIMKPLGTVFQVTETLDFKKYFLDIDKLEFYPITFVIKTEKDPNEVLEYIKKAAESTYDSILIDKYLACFERIITIPSLLLMLSNNIKKGYLEKMIEEMVIQSKVEYNIN